MADTTPANAGTRSIGIKQPLNWCQLAFVLVLIILCAALIARALCNYQECGDGLLTILSGAIGGIWTFPWGGPVARLLYVMSACGTLGALAHRVVLLENQRPISRDGRGNKELFKTLLGDALVGAVAANVLHFPLGSFFDYPALLSPSASHGKLYLSIIALALLAGYTGPALLEALARKFQDSVAAKLEERLKSKEDILNRTLRFLLQDVLTKRVIPNATDLELLKAKFEEVQQLEVEGGIENLAVLDSIMAGYYCLERENYSEAVRYLEYANDKLSDLPDGQRWAAKNLLALAYHYDCIHQHDWFNKTLKCHQEALASNPTPVQEAITRVNMGFAKLDNLDLTKVDNDALAKVDEDFVAALKRSQRFPGEYRSITDVAHLGRAVLFTGRAIASATAGTPPELAEAIKELKEIANPKLIEYLLKDGSVAENVINTWRNGTGIPAEIKALLNFEA